MYSEFVYVLKAGPFYKIGRTTDISKRTATLSIQLPFPIELFKVLNTDDSVALERELHEKFAAERVNGEWFELSPHSAGYLFLFPPSIGYRLNDSMADSSWGDQLFTMLDAHINCRSTP